MISVSRWKIFVCFLILLMCVRRSVTDMMSLLFMYAYISYFFLSLCDQFGFRKGMSTEDAVFKLTMCSNLLTKKCMFGKSF
jgi:hypothetical protein